MFAQRLTRYYSISTMRMSFLKFCRLIANKIEENLSNAKKLYLLYILSFPITYLFSFYLGIYYIYLWEITNISNTKRIFKISSVVPEIRNKHTNKLLVLYNCKIYIITSRVRHLQNIIRRQFTKRLSRCAFPGPDHFGKH